LKVKLIAVLSYSSQWLLSLGIGAEFFSQTDYRDIEGAGTRVGSVPPHIHQQRLARSPVERLCREIPEEEMLSLGQGDDLVGVIDLPMVKIDETGGQKQVAQRKTPLPEQGTQEGLSWLSPLF